MTKASFLVFLFFPLAAFSINLDSLHREVNRNKSEAKFYAAAELTKYYSCFQSTTLTPEFNLDSAGYYASILEKSAKNNVDRKIVYHQVIGWYIAYSDIVKSIEHIKAALELAKDLKDNLRIADAYFLLAQVYYQRVDLGPALQNFFNALNLYKVLKHDQKTRLTYEIVADMLFAYRHIEKSIEYYELSLVNLHNNAAKGLIYNKIANSYLQTENYEKSKEYCFKAISALSREKFKTELALTYNLLGKIYFEKKDYMPAINYYKKSLDILANRAGTENLNSTFDSYEVTAYLGLGNIFVALGDIKTASDYLNKGKDKAEQIQPDFSLMEIYNQLYMINEKLGNTELAYTYLLKAFKLANFFFGGRSSNGFAQNLIQVYEAEQKENYTIVSLQNENQQQKLINQQQSEKLMYLLIFAGVLLLFAGAFYYRYKERKRISQYLEQQVESRTQELKAQSQEKTLMLKEIHHRVKNNLQLISSFLNLQKHYATNKPADIIISETQERVRCMAIIHEKLYSAQSLAKLDTKSYLSEIATYVYQSYVSSASSIQLKLDIDSVIMPLDKMIPCGLILNELISNSFKYGFKGRDEGEVRVQFKEVDGIKKFSVCDNGIGLPPNFNLQELNSLGMNIVVGLIEQLDATLDIASNNGSCFYITFS